MRILGRHATSKTVMSGVLLCNIVEKFANMRVKELHIYTHTLVSYFIVNVSRIRIILLQLTFVPQQSCLSMLRAIHSSNRLIVLFLIYIIH